MVGFGHIKVTAIGVIAGVGWEVPLPFPFEAEVGLLVGLAVGEFVGLSVGLSVGLAVGEFVGLSVGLVG